jgi:methylmalonyl-CoA/ethylmalonyl-CoA epimerase
MRAIEHIGIAVQDIDEAEKTYAKLLGVSSYKRESVESEGVITSFFRVGDVKIELLAATKSDSAIAKFIEKRGEGVHHIAFNVKDTNESLSAKENQGFITLNETAKLGADNKEIAFIHPKSTHGVLVEMCSDKKVE